MKFLLIVYMFTINPVTQNPENFEVLKQAFPTMEACNYAGRNLRELTGTNGPRYDRIKTLSTCVSTQDFQPSSKT